MTRLAHHVYLSQFLEDFVCLGTSLLVLVLLFGPGGLPALLFGSPFPVRLAITCRLIIAKSTFFLRYCFCLLGLILSDDDRDVNINLMFFP